MNAEDFINSKREFKINEIDDKHLESCLENNCTLERILNQECPFCDAVTLNHHYKLCLYSYGYRLGITVFNEQFYKISCSNCGTSSGIHLGLEKAIEEFFKVCMKTFDETEKKNV